MILYFDGKNTIMCQNASQIMIDLIFIRSYQMQSFWQKIPLYPLILSVKLRYFDINLPFSLIYSRILIAYIIVLLNTGKSFSEALILESTNPQYDKRLFIEL